MKQNPFSFYDFLGYLIPGAFLLYTLFFLGSHYNWSVAFELNKQLPKNNSLGDILSLFPLVISSYITGHLLSLSSSSVIEMYSKYKNGYPSTYLISGSKKKCYFSFSKKSELAAKIFIFVLTFPISSFDTIFFFFRQDEEMSFKLKAPVFEACKKILNDKFLVDTASMNESTGLDGDSFRLIYHFSFENSEQHANKLQNYVALYGFTRNISMAALVLFWLLLNLKVVFNFAIGVYPIIISAATAIVFYKGFVKFYRRYSLEAMMAACIIQAKEQKDSST